MHKVIFAQMKESTESLKQTFSLQSKADSRFRQHETLAHPLVGLFELV